MRKFKFAVMGAGNIANKFCEAVKLLKDCEVTAVSSKSMERARGFAEKNGLKAAYDNYEEMLIEEKPDCVYIAVTPDAHYELAMLCLDHSTPVLCEKAMFMNLAQAEVVFERSKKQRVFVMEAMWSRFLPAVKTAKQWLEEGRIGKPSFADFAIGFLAPEDPERRYFNVELGGGAAFDITVYAYEITTFLIDKKVEEMQVSAIWGGSGIDITDHITLLYPDMLASLNASFVAAVDERLIIYGSGGKIIIPHPHYAEDVYLYTNDNKLSFHYHDDETKNGFSYEIRDVMECIQAGKIESSIVPHELTLQCSELFDKITETKRYRK